MCDKREISALREFKTILDRDKEQLFDQNNQLIKEKDDLIAQLDKKLIDMAGMYKE